ncbi:MAG: RNA polymerase sigma factor [Planctomycetaceae bacterium]
MAEGSSDQAESIESLYRQLSRELWALFYSQCSDPERSYDAVQEAFLRYQRHNGEPIRDARAWLLRVGQNWLRDVARRKSSGCRLSSSLDEMPNTPFSPAELMASEENRLAVRAALEQMLEDDRKVLVMKYALNWSSAQMAVAMDASPAAIDMRLSRARRRLSELLLEQGFGDE